MFPGMKTYFVAGLMLVHAVSAYLLGHDTSLDVRQVLEAIGLAALRAGVAKS